MSRLMHLYEPGMTYLITTVTHHREKVFADAACAQAAHVDVSFYARKFTAASLAHAIMPDHMHWVIYPSPEDFERFARTERFTHPLTDDRRRHGDAAATEWP